MSDPQFERKRALLVGEALIDIVVPADGATAEHVGGSPANTAIGVARLGHEAHLLTQIGRDGRGERIAEHLVRDGVVVHPSSWRATQTSTAVARIGGDGAAEYEFDFEWDIPEITVPEVELVFVGSLGLFYAPGGAAAISLLQQATGRALTAIDPNIRASLLGEHAAVVAAFEQAASLSDLVKLSDEDAEWLYPGESSGEVARRLLGLGARLVVVTLGAAGSEAYAEGISVAVPAAPTTVVDTISAGDSLMASLLASLLEEGVAGVVATEASLRRVLARAAQAAALAVAKPGANPPSRAELEAALA